MGLQELKEIHIMRLTDIIVRAMELSNSEAVKEYSPEQSFKLMCLWREFFVQNTVNGSISIPSAPPPPEQTEKKRNK